MAFVSVKHKIYGHSEGDVVGNGVDEHWGVNFIVADATLTTHSFAGKLALRVRHGQFQV